VINALLADAKIEKVNTSWAAQCSDVRPYWLNHDAVGVAQVGYGPQRNSYSVTL
jgi:hypothetical protein